MLCKLALLELEVKVMLESDADLLSQKLRVRYLVVKLQHVVETGNEGPSN